MAKKRKVDKTFVEPKNQKSTKYDIDETFDDSEDEFYAGRDKVLLDRSPNENRRRRIAEQEEELQPSDEEVLSPGTDEEELSGLEHSFPLDGDDSDQGWGTNRADYFNADVIETEADALEEEAEARRLQQKQLQSMTKQDFGFDEDAWTNINDFDDEIPRVVVKLPEPRIASDATQQERQDILEMRYPEFTLLAQDFIKLQARLTDMKEEVEIARLHKGTFGPGISAVAKFRALSAYVGALAMYFAVLSANAGQADDSDGRVTALAPHDVREHAIVGTLTKARRLWDQVQDIKIAPTVAPKEEPRPNGILKNSTQIFPGDTAPQPSKKAKAKPVNTSVELKSQGDKDTRPKKEPKLKPAKLPKSKSSDLQAIWSQAAPVEDESDFGDENPLTEEQAADKARKRKSLRFYTSQIAQKANKRGAASREAGGDDDVPHKERHRERQERLLREAEARGRAKAADGEELGGDDVDDGGAGGFTDDGDDYYQTLATMTQKKKSDKKERAEAYAEAARQGAQVFEEETVGPDGKRAITYAIEKNKGLAPKRNKDVRNPRVKKRKKYDEKMKKLSSIRQVYKGGEGRGGYGGELTGIKTNVVKSIKL